jgi:hypothetical protein
MLTGEQPRMEDILLGGTNLSKRDIVKEKQGDLFYD